MLQELVVLAELDSHPTELEGGLHASDELGGSHGLREEIVSAGFQRPIEGIDVAKSGEKDDRGLRAAWEGANARTRLEAVDVRHAHVQEDAVRRFAFEGNDSRPAVVGQDDAVALVLQRAPGESPIRVVIVDDEDGGAWKGDVIRHEFVPTVGVRTGT